MYGFDLRNIVIMTSLNNKVMMYLKTNAIINFSEDELNYYITNKLSLNISFLIKNCSNGTIII